MHVTTSIFAEHAKPKGHCPLCNKAFLKDSTLKRHYYYCRSKRPDSNAHRRRSCAACVRAKTRCTWLSGTGTKVCARCDERGTKCEYQSDPGSDLVPGVDVQDDLGFSFSDHQPNLEGMGASQASAHDHNYHHLSALVDTLSDNSWDSSDPGDFGLRDLATSSSHDGSDTSPTILSELSDTLVTGISTLQKNSPPSAAPHPPNFRHVMRPRHVSLVSLATRMLRSYPYMLLQNGTFPPFLSPQLYMWARSRDGPQQQALLNCISLVQMFKLRKDENPDLVWGLIKSEQERILAEYTGFDQWELLGCLQALLFYCLLRLQGDAGKQERLDAALLNTVSAVSSALSVLVKCDCSLPSDPNMAWRDWIFNESRRRTALVFRALNLLVYDSAAISCFPAFGFGLIPLPNKATLWTPLEVEKWKAEFDICFEERTLYGLSEFGNLVKLQHTEAGIQQTVAEWDEWGAEVGELGALVSIMGELLRG